MMQKRLIPFIIAIFILNITQTHLWANSSQKFFHSIKSQNIHFSPLMVGAVFIANEKKHLQKNAGPFDIDVITDNGAFLVEKADRDELDLLIIHSHFWPDPDESPNEVGRGFEKGQMIFSNGITLFGPQNTPISSRLRKTKDPVKAIKLILAAQIPLVVNVAHALSKPVGHWYKLATGKNLSSLPLRAHGPDAIKLAAEKKAFTFFTLNAFMIRSGGLKSGLVPYEIRSKRGLLPLSSYVYSGTDKITIEKAREFQKYLLGSQFQKSLTQFRYEELGDYSNIPIFFNKSSLSLSWRLTIKERVPRRFTFNPKLDGDKWAKDKQGNFLLVAESDFGTGVLKCSTAISSLNDDNKTNPKSLNCHTSQLKNVMSLNLHNLTGKIKQGFSVGEFRIGRGGFHLVEDES